MVGTTAAKILVFLLAVWLFHVHPFAGDNTTDYFIPIAQRLIQQGSFNDTATRDYSTVPPGYPFLLSLFYRLDSSGAFPAVVCLQFLADLAVALVLLELGRRFGSMRAGTAAAVIWLIFPPAIVISSWISPEAIFTALMMGALLLICVKDGELSGAHAAWSGLLFGVATLVRGNTLIVPCLLAPFWLWRRQFRAAVVFVAAFALPVGAWTLRNYVELGDPIVASSNFGSVFLQGSDERFYHDKASAYPPLFAEAARAGITKPAIETSSNISHWLFSVGAYRYRVRLQDEGWLRVAGQLARKLTYMWFLTESGSGRSQMGLAICALAVVPLGLWQLLLWLRPGNAAKWIPGLVVAGWMAFEVLILPLARYTVSIMPVLLLAACFRVDALVRGRTESIS